MNKYREGDELQTLYATPHRSSAAVHLPQEALLPGSRARNSVRRRSRHARQSPANPIDSLVLRSLESTRPPGGRSRYLPRIRVPCNDELAGPEAEIHCSCPQNSGRTTTSDHERQIPRRRHSSIVKPSRQAALRHTRESGPSLHGVSKPPQVLLRYSRRPDRCQSRLRSIPEGRRLQPYELTPRGRSRASKYVANPGDRPR